MSCKLTSKYGRSHSREGIIGMNPSSLSYTENKLKTTKIVTASNTADKRIISKIPFEYMHPE